MLAIASALCAPLAVWWSSSLRRAPYGMLPFLLWWGWWTVAGLLSVANTME